MELLPALVPLGFAIVLVVVIAGAMLADGRRLTVENLLLETEMQEHLSHREQIRRWEAIGEELGIERVDNYPKEQLRLEGVLGGFDVTVRRSVRAGDSETVFEVGASELMPDGFAVVPQNAPQFVDRLVDREDIYVGDETLDRRFVFHGVDSSEVQSFVWAEGVDEHLRHLLKLGPGVHIRDGCVRGRIPGNIPRPDRATRWVRHCVEWCEALRRILQERTDEATVDPVREWKAGG